MRRAKIVCTLGPATNTPEVLSDMIRAGMNVARLNLSHGTHEDHARNYELVRAAAHENKVGVAILADLQGPKIRLGKFKNGPIYLVRGDRFTITSDDIEGNQEICGTTYKGLPGDCKVGDLLHLNDGRVSLEVTNVTATSVDTKCVQPGELSDSKGINIPDAFVNVPALSNKDAEDLRWALKQGVDLVALSFVRDASDYDDVQHIMDEVGIHVPVIAKIEKPQAIANLEAIVKKFEGIMVARGDLGVELPLEQVPLVQKRIIALARAYAKPVIVATQMLDSMEHSPRPTRAEASDVANAVLDGADALMLSGETSIGEFPVHVVETMSKIIEHIEVEALDKLPALVAHDTTIPAMALCEAAVQVAKQVNAVSLVPFTETGRSANLVAIHRPATQITAFTTNPRVRNQLALLWGTETFLVPPVMHTDDMVVQVDKTLLDLDRFKANDNLVFIAGVPPGVPGTTNGMRIHRLGRGAENR